MAAYKWESKTKNTRRKAFVVAVALHVLIIGGLVWYSGGGDPTMLIPEFVMEMVGSETP